DQARDCEREIWVERRRGVAGHEHAGGVGAEREQRDPADRELSGEADHQVQARHQHPVHTGSLRDHPPVAASEQRQRKANNEQDEERQGVAEPTRTEERGSGGHRLRGGRVRHTRRCVEAPASPSGNASSTKIKAVNTATEAKIPPTMKLAACWNSPRIRPATTAPRL